MKGIWLFILIGSCETVKAFHASLPCQVRTVNNFAEQDAIDVIVIQAVSSDDAIERLRRQQSEFRAMEEEKPPILFDQDIIDEMIAAYTTLEKRVQQGPGSLSRLEKQELELRLHKVMHEMRVNQHLRPIKPQTRSKEELGGATVVDPTFNPAANGGRRANVVQSFQSTNKSYDIDISDDEGPRYDGTGGMGQPRGTVNTYAIPGMEEMSKDEYMRALQDQIINVQEERRRKGYGGNKSSWDYLSSLTGQPEGVLNRKPDSG